MTSKLSTLLKDIDVVEIIGETDKNITSLESDSRKVEKDGLFVAVKGVTNDGHKYIPMVASAHVGAIVCENLPAMFEKGVTYIKVSDSAEALGRLASAWYGHPSSRLKLVGVTGTNGKTTTATLLYEMAKLEGFKAGLLSTVCNYVVDRAVPTTHTTPDPLTINSFWRRWCRKDVNMHSWRCRRMPCRRSEWLVFSLPGASSPISPAIILTITAQLRTI